MNDHRRFSGENKRSPKIIYIFEKETVVFLEKSAIIQPQPERQDRHCEGLGMTDPHRSEDREVVAMVSVSRSFPGPGLARQSVSPRPRSISGILSAFKATGRS